MNPRVTEVHVMRPYQLALTFANGERKAFNCEPYLNKGFFVQLKNLEYFNQVRVMQSGGTIHWPNGQDFCPDTLYLASENLKE